ncbi:MAG TPA: hypothetical protein VF800_15650 [Telluria sp.]|jgi:hypothetical protein
MGQLICRCGNSISTTGQPCKHEFTLIANVDSEGLTDKIIEIAEAGEDSWPKIDFLISASGRLVFKCEVCQGMLIFWNGTEKSPTYYKPVD